MSLKFNSPNAGEYPTFFRSKYPALKTNYEESNKGFVSLILF